MEEILLGNEAIGRGLVEAGCRVVASYPGTPSSEIVPAVVRYKQELNLDGLYVEWSTNEKVAFEVALAASWSGLRAAAVMKQVGLNVAADAATSAAYSGVDGGFIVIAADDPGPHSSQTEQDSRLFALLAKIPTLDPTTPQEAKVMVGAAFELSEQFGMPVMLRPAVRVCHAKQNVQLGEVPSFENRARFRKNPQRWVAAPRPRYFLHVELNERLRQVQEFFQTSPLNSVPDGRGPHPLGIIAGGACYPTIVELLEGIGLEADVPVCKVGTPYPLPARRVMDFVERCEQVLILEETDAVIELQLPNRQRVAGRMDGTVPGAGELTPDMIYEVLRGQLQKAGLVDMSTLLEPFDPSTKPVLSLSKGSGYRRTQDIAGFDGGLPPGQDETLQTLVDELELPPRPPRLCSGCGHRSTFYAIKRSLPQALLPSDIGCYTLGLNLRAVDTVLDMGASISMAAGFYHAHRLSGKDKPIVATIGDSTFIHAGLPALANAVHTEARFVLVIMDNRVTAMTGFQPTVDSDRLAAGAGGTPVSLEDLAHGCGVRFLRVIDPYEIEDLQELIKEAHAYTRQPDGGVAVIIARRPCVLYHRDSVEPIRVEVDEECDGCRYCLVAFECPALVMNEEGDRVEIDRRLCVDCAQCIEACYKGLIVPVEALAGERVTV
ncbi:MAG: thiamine pyrophosphate-dependent enzyme [Anaerolineae bacterium]